MSGSIQVYYVKALTAYEDGNWEKAASNFEKSLNHYYLEEERCRAQCESGYVHSGFPDFTTAIAGMYIYSCCRYRTINKIMFLPKVPREPPTITS